MQKRWKLSWSGRALATTGCLLCSAAMAQHDDAATGGAFPTFDLNAPGAGETAPPDGAAASAFPTFDVNTANAGSDVTIAPPGAPADMPDMARVGSCFVAHDQPESDPEILVEVEIDPAGMVASLPVMIEPEEPTAEQRLLFVYLVAALEDCAPYADGSQGKHRLAATEDNVSLVSAASSPAIAAARPGPIPGAETWTPATPEVEEALELSRREKAELQARLMLLGHDPNGIDGMPGNGTRSALSAWQDANGIPASGYLDQVQMTILLQQSQPAYTAWLQEPANRELIEGAAAVAAPKAQTKATGNKSATLPPGYFWYKGRMCKKVFGRKVISCK